MKPQWTVSIPRSYMSKLEKWMEENKDYCAAYEIDSTAKLLRVLANLGYERFEETVEQWRTTRKKSQDSSQRK